MKQTYVIGVDYGSDSVRAVIVEALTGRQISQGTADYPRWKKGWYTHPEEMIFRQHPLDYLEALEKSIKEALAELPESVKGRIVGISVAATGSTPAPVNREGTPLALLDGFRENENAMFYLWKDHSAVLEAIELNHIFSAGTEIDYTKYQGTYSAEWYWAKILHGIRKDPAVREAAYTWVEHCDWIVGVLCGNRNPETLLRSACAAGHKALWHSEWNGLPERACLEMADPYLCKIAERYKAIPKAGGTVAGPLTTEWCEKLGLLSGVMVSAGSFDAHAGAVGAGIRPKRLVCTLGTSAADMLIAKPETLEGADITNYCGQAENSIVDGYIGIETGQAAFGDTFAWFRELLLWPVRQLKSSLYEDEDGRHSLCDELERHLFSALEEAAEALPWNLFPVSSDWFNGRRYPDADDFQKAAINGLTLGTTAPEIYRSLVLGTLCGLKRIIDGLEASGLEIEQIAAIGGISKKSGYIMQTMADLLEKKVAILDTDQTCALGAAIYAAVGAGEYEDVETAMRHMAAKKIREYVPQKENALRYLEYYKEYCKMAE